MDGPPTEDELRALEADHSNAVVRYDRDFVVTGWSRGAALLFGWTTDEALGRAGAELVNMPATAQGQAKVEELRRQLLEAGEVHFNEILYAKDGVAVLLDAHVFLTDDSYVGVMKGRQAQFHAESRPKLRQINLRLPEELIADIEDLRGMTPRDRFLRKVIASYVEEIKRGEPRSDNAC